MEDIEDFDDDFSAPALSLDMASFQKSGAIRDQMMLDIFSIDDTRFSNTIEIYDALPKYSHQDKRSTDLSTAERERYCRIGKDEYRVVIKPAIIKGDNGETELVYPGQREELVESVLRKFAVEGQGEVFRNEYGVSFTLYQLHKALKSSGHGYSIKEIKEAILVCREASLNCHTINGESVISSGFFQVARLTSREDWQKDPSGSRCVVVFNPLVTRSILNVSFRAYNYQVNMAIKSPLARFIHKKMSHNYRQASLENPYSFKLVTFLKSSEREFSPRMPENVRAMKNALEHLIKHHVVERFDFEKITNGQATVDVKYDVYPHANFVKDVIAANKAQGSKKVKAIRGSISQG